jgi:hypothetical protein
VVKLDLRGSLREQITRLNSVANPTPPAISSPSMPIAFSLARIWSPNLRTGFEEVGRMGNAKSSASRLLDPNFGLPVAGFVVRDSGVEERFYSMRKREAENIASCRERDVLDAIDHVTHR